MSYEPAWSRELSGCAYNIARRHWNRLHPWYEWDDLMQEAFMVFLHCQRRYAGKVDNPAWFMSLFKIAWQRRLIGLFRENPAYSLPREALPEVAAPDLVQEMFELLDAVPLELQAVLLDLCRKQPRFRFTRKQIAPLRALLRGA